jgi:hypothetical protein
MPTHPRYDSSVENSFYTTSHPRLLKIGTESGSFGTFYRAESHSAQSSRLVENILIFANGENAMRLILAVTIGLAMLALMSPASARDAAARLGCPKGYAPLGEICVSTASGDIVLPIRSNTATSSQARAGR